MEIWKPVPYAPFAAKYSISNAGRVKPNEPSRYSKNGAEVLVASPSPRGYLHVSLYANGKQKSAFVHRMVALAFIGPPPFRDAIVCHKDDCKTHNAVSNLEWGTQKSNAATRERIGIHSSRGEGNGRARVTATQVAEIRAAYAAGGISQQALADRYGIGQTVVSKIVLRTSWRHV